MTTQSRTRLFSTRVSILWIGIGIALLVLSAAHLYLTRQAEDFVSPLLMLDRAFDVLFATVVALCALGYGRMILRALNLVPESIWAETSFAFALGLGAISLGLLLLGLARGLHSFLILGLLAASALFTLREWLGWARTLAATVKARVPLSRAEKFLLVGLLLLMLPVFLATLTLPTDNDALAYHLAAPQLFLREQVIVPSFDNVGVNYPIALDLIYLFGLAASSVIAAQLMHWFCALAITVGIYALLAARVSRRAGLLACVMYWCSSVVGMEASTPIIDLAWGMYEFLAVYVLLRWWETRARNELILLGLMLGFAVSNKYLALAGWGLLSALVFAKIFWEERTRGFFYSMRAGLLKVALVLGVALAIFSPWLLKNFFWLGNPIYPFFGGAYGLAGVVDRSAGNPGDWVGMGLGRDVWALLKFPYNVYVNWQYFNYGFNRGGPTLFFLLLPLYFFVAKRTFINLVFLVIAARFLFWFMYAQNMRYLVVIFPLIAIVCAYTLDELLKRTRRPSLNFGLALLVGVFILWGIVTQWGLLLAFRAQSVPFLVGMISRAEYLEMNLLGYHAQSFMDTSLAPESVVFALGDQRLFYAERKIIPDDSHANWQRIVALGGTSDGIARELQEMKVTHVWVSKDDLAYFKNNWRIESPLDDELFHQFRAQHLELVYQDERGHTIYRLAAR